MTVTTLSVVPTAFLLLTPGASAQESGVVGIKFTSPTSYDGSATTLLPTDAAGALQVTNWNNYFLNGAFPTVQGTNNLLDSTGANVGVSLSIAGLHNAWHNNTIVNQASSANARLLIDTFILRSGNVDTYTIGNLPAAGNYNVYVYLSGQDPADQVQVECLNTGITNYQTEGGTAVTNNQVLVQGNNTTPGTYPSCNYVLYSGIIPTAGTISISIWQNGTSANGGVAGLEIAPSSPTFFAIAPQPQSTLIALGQNATFTAGAVESPAVANTYQWYEISGGVTNLIAGATANSYTTNSPTVGAGYYVVVGNGSTSLTSSVAQLSLYNGGYTNGTWNASSGSWNIPGNWMGNATAGGFGSTAQFVNGLGGTVTLDNASGFTVGTSIYGAAGAMTVQPSWTINPGSPAGTLTMALAPTISPVVVSGSSADTVSGVPLITVYPYNPVTINAPLAGNQGLHVNGGGTVVLAGGNTNNTYSGPTVIGDGTADTTALQIGNGGTSGAIDPSSPIYLSGYAELIFNRSDTITMSNILWCQASKAVNEIVNSGTVILAPPTESPQFWDGVIVNGGKLVLDCPVGVTAFNNSGGTVNIANGAPASATNGLPNGGNTGNVSLGINAGGIVQLAGPGGNGVNIPANNGVLDNGIFDLGGDAVQVFFIAGTGIVTNTGATLATLTLGGGQPNAAYPWNGTIADGTTAKTAVTLSGGTTAFTGPNTYTGNTILSGGSLMLSNSASLASANILIGSGRTLDVTGLGGSFSLNAGQSLVVTNTGVVNAGANTVNAGAGSSLFPGANGTAGTMTVNGNLTLNGNTNAFDLATITTEGGGVNDEIVGVANLTLSGNITIRVNTSFNSAFNPTTTYRLIKYTGSLANTATFTVVPSTLGGNSVSIDTTSQPGYVLLKTGGSSPPLITVLSSNIDAFPGYPVTLPVAESGSTPLTNQWYNGAAPVPGATSPNYTFTPSIPGVYTYTLRATNAFGATNAAITVNVGSPTISIQCALSTAQFSGALYLAPTDTAGAYGASNWNDIIVSPSATTAVGITSTNLVDDNGSLTPASFTAVNVQDGWHELQTITSADTANARFMNTYWYANPIGGHTPATNAIAFTVTNLPNDTYDVYIYLLQQVSSGHNGNAEVYDSGITNFASYSDSFTSTSNFVDSVDTTGTGAYPYANYVKLRISTGGTNSISFGESGTVAGTGGAGVTGIQIVPVPSTAPTIIQQPTSQRVTTNLTATFTVQADGFPLAYQWYSISTDGVTNAVANATDASYTTPPVQDTDTGTGFFVVVSNSINQVQSSTAVLTAGHMVTASGLLIDDQFYITENFPYVFINDLYPNSGWLTINQPTVTKYPDTFETVSDLPIEPPPQSPEGERIHGWFTPAVSGDYVFFVTSDNAGSLWLSTDNTPGNAYLIAQNQSWMIDRDWTCSNTSSGEFTGGYSTDGEFRSDLFISGGGQEAFNEFTTGWTATPTFNSGDNGITLVAGTPYYIELDNYYGGSDSQNAAVTYKLAGQADPVVGSAPLLTGDNISASVPDLVVPIPTPVITKISLTTSGSQVIISADNGLLNAQCNVQTSTNLTQWTTSGSGLFDTSGNFSTTNVFAPQTQTMFYRLQQMVP